MKIAVPAVLAGCVLFLTSCATMFNKAEESVTFTNAPVSGITVVQTPEGKIPVSHGEATRKVLRRSRKNIPITVTCPDRTVHAGFVVTEFDYLTGGVLNVLNIIGWFIDPFSDKAFLYNPVDLSRYCGGPRRVKAGPLSGVGVE